MERRSLNRNDIINALERIGRILVEQDKTFDLTVFGGSAIALGWEFRQSTNDVAAEVITGINKKLWNYRIFRRLATSTATSLSEKSGFCFTDIIASPTCFAHRSESMFWACFMVPWISQDTFRNPIFWPVFPLLFWVDIT